MKILIVIPSFYPAIVYGGPVFTSKHTAEELSRINLSISVVTTNANMTNRLNIKTNIWHKWNNSLFVKYYNETIINYLSLSQIFNIWKDIKSSDIVHLQVLFRDLVPFVLLYSKLLKKPVLLTPHGALGDWCLDNGSRFKSSWLKYLIKPFNSIITWHATAEMEKEHILNVFPNAKVKVIPNGIKTEEFKVYNKLTPIEFIKKFTSENLDAGKIIISMGRLQKVKGFNILIDSFNTIIKKYPNSKLFIAGQDEGEKNNLLHQIDKLNLKKSVFLIGNISGQNKIDFFANADIFVLPSHNENFGVVFAESLAAGTPIIASKNTPWEEIEIHNCGKWVNNTPKEISNAMIDLLKNNRDEMRKNSLEYSKKFDWSNIAQEFKNHFKYMRNSYE